MTWVPPLLQAAIAINETPLKKFYLVITLFFSLLYRMWNWTEINSVGSQLRRYVALSLCKIYNFKTILLVSPIINVWIVMWKILTLWARKFKTEFFLVNWFGTWENFFFQSKRKFRLGAKRLVFSFSHQFLMMDEFNDKFQTSLFDLTFFRAYWFSADRAIVTYF